MPASRPVPCVPLTPLSNIACILGSPRCGGAAYGTTTLESWALPKNIRTAMSVPFFSQSQLSLTNPTTHRSISFSRPHSHRLSLVLQSAGINLSLALPRSICPISCSVKFLVFFFMNSDKQICLPSGWESPTQPSLLDATPAVSRSDPSCAIHVGN